MNTVINGQDGKYIVSLEGELDTAHAIEVEEAMKPLHEVNGKEITIDCSHLDYIASSGLRILLGLLKSAKANGNKVVLKSLNDEIKDVFKMTGFIDLFDIE
jgi:anti-anti-sigma factor